MRIQFDRDKGTHALFVFLSTVQASLAYLVRVYTDSDTSDRWQHMVQVCLFKIDLVITEQMSGEQNSVLVFHSERAY